MPIRVLHSRSLASPPPPHKHPVYHAYKWILAKMSHHSPQTSPHSLPPIHLLFIPPSSRQSVINTYLGRVRMNCMAAANSHVPSPSRFALSVFHVPFVTIFT